MPLYRVTTREVHVQDYLIEATDEETARNHAIQQGDLMEDSFEFSHLLHPSTFTVKLEPVDENNQ